MIITPINYYKQMKTKHKLLLHRSWTFARPEHYAITMPSLGDFTCIGIENHQTPELVGVYDVYGTSAPKLSEIYPLLASMLVGGTKYLRIVREKTTLTCSFCKRGYLHVKIYDHV